MAESLSATTATVATTTTAAAAAEASKEQQTEHPIIKLAESEPIDNSESDQATLKAVSEAKEGADRTYQHQAQTTELQERITDLQKRLLEAEAREKTLHIALQQSKQDAAAAAVTYRADQDSEAITINEVVTKVEKNLSISRKNKLTFLENFGVALKHHLSVDTKVFSFSLTDLSNPAYTHVLRFAIRAMLELDG